MPDWELTESEARSLPVDPQLEKAMGQAGNRTRVLRAIPIGGYDANPWNRATDCCHNPTDGRDLAVGETIRWRRKRRAAASVIAP